ncbi:AlwI family type II restriction endonuclease [Lactococcus garvieae subsp. garvieae]|nr:AlwI family type II restriction endonuclease [Lactococcus garvieae]KAA8711091.1 AlwI family type II restriction endonuclease [Lactococcus garvieae subsp. garvieae]MDG6192238.1 AlwI family type II restriction endonuclease [Lactococcus garvieae]QPR49583.1 AlwI family type II restriction endonuclease [Lactococcus garvieae]
MRLDSNTSIFNMGDTSIRVNQFVEVNKIILQQVQKFMLSQERWERNTLAQEEFYCNFLEEIVKIESEEGVNLFRDFARSRNYTPPSKGRVGLRGRTLTNAIVKSGLLDSKRRITDVGKKYLQDNIKPADNIEKILGLDVDNLIYLRQYLKLRIYDSKTDDYFNNFRFAIKFLSRYENIPQNDFLKIVESVKPSQADFEIQKIIDDYSEVYRSYKTFEEYYIETFSTTLRTEEELKAVKEMFQNKDFTDENFIKYFYNRDSNDTSLLYKKFVLSLIDLIDNHSESSFETIKRLSRDDKIKKAFSEGKIPFTIRRNDSITTFLENNIGNPLLSNDSYDIYLEFIFSKHDDLIREYSDMGRRAFQVTGIIQFDNGLVNLNSKWLFEPLLNILGDSFELSGSSSYKSYEENEDSSWFQDLTLSEILNISPEDEIELLNIIGKKFNTTDLIVISQHIEDEREKEYREFVESHFPREKIINILENISVRDDESVFGLVTDSATIPTIYEYILTIAWYHLSETKNFKLSTSFQVTLDANKLPLSHRGGGAGDIEIITDEYALLIEATLMDMNTQKRGEMEPVIRHSINFALENSSISTQSIFIANELDNNVLNVFRGTQFIELNGTQQNNGCLSGLNIFAFTTKEVMNLLKLSKRDTAILAEINSNIDSSPVLVKNSWRNSIVEKIMNEI